VDPILDSAFDPAAARAVERNACPTCAVAAGSPCRGRSGNTALTYHTPRVLLVPALHDAVEVRIPQDRGPGRPWTPGPAIAPAPLRIGYAYSTSTTPNEDEDLGGQLAALRAVPCDRIFTEQVGPSVARRTQLDAVLELARATTGQPALVTVTEVRRFARTSAELISLAGILRAAGVGLQVLTGALAGTHDPDATGPTLFTILEAAADLDRTHRSETTREGQRAAAEQGRRAGRPKALDDDMVALACRLRDEGTPVPDIAARLTIATGRNAGRHPSIASVYRTLAADDEARRATPVSR
jgi:DNA invertase Pin-like site-specific DNA recombinase